MLCRRARYFLDCVCIPQRDARTKGQAIQSIGTILDHSDQMLILMDEHYWSRLWCVFELAAFYHRAGTPARSCNSFCRFVLVHHSLAIIIIINVVLIIPRIGLLLLAYREGMASCESLLFLNPFRLTDVACFDSADRVAIHLTIAK